MRRNRLILAWATLGTLVPALAFAQNRVVGTRPGWLGIGCNVTVEVRDGRANVTVGVGEIIEGSPAERSGLRVGDRILRIDGKPIAYDNCDLIRRGLEAGDTVRLHVQGRAGERERDLVVIAAARPDNMPVPRLYGDARVFTFNVDTIRRLAFTFLDSAGLSIDTLFGDSMFMRPFPGVGVFRGGRIHLDSIPGRFMFFDTLPGEFRVRIRPLDTELPFEFTPRLELMGSRGVAGAEFTEIVPGLADYFGTDQGLLVTRVGPDTPAARAGLTPGDVITRIDGRAVHGVEDLRTAVRRAGDQPLKVEIIRKKKQSTLELVARPIRRE